MRLTRAVLDGIGRGLEAPLPSLGASLLQHPTLSADDVRIVVRAPAWDGAQTEQVPMPQVSKAKRVLVGDEMADYPGRDETPTRYRGKRRDA